MCHFDSLAQKNPILDSLTNIARNASHDSVAANAYVACITAIDDLSSKSSFSYYKKIDSICINQLELSISEIERFYFNRLIAWTQFKMGLYYKKHKKFDESLISYRKSLNYYTIINDSENLCWSNHNMGVVYYLMGRLDSAKIRLDRGLNCFLNNSHKLGQYHALSYLAALSKGKGEFNHTIANYKQNLSIAMEMHDSDKIVQTLYNLGISYQNQGLIEQSVRCYDKALQARVTEGNKNVIGRVLTSLVTQFEAQGKIAKAIEYSLKGLKINENLNDSDGLGRSLTQISNLYLDQGEFELATKFAERALAISLKSGFKLGQIVYYSTLGNITHELGNDNKAKMYFKKCLDISYEINDDRGVCSAMANLGLISLNQGNLNEALAYNLKALELAEKDKNENYISLMLNNLGYLYFDMNQFEKAQSFALKSLRISRKMQSPLRTEQAAELLYKLFNHKGDYKKALEMYELHIQMRDSINNESTQKAAIKQNMQYEYEKQHLADSLETSKEIALKDIEISKQQAEAKAERTTKYGLFGGLALVLVIALVLFRSVQQKKKANDEITIQKQEVEHKNKEILDSITYAERIQSAILPPMNLMNEKLKDGFVLYKPKDIVAGDFYWLETVDDDIYFSAADCTGHGVPGAMMSVMCSNALTKCVKEMNITSPSKILDQTTKIIEGRFERSGELVLDGMDLALCKLNLQTMTLEYAGANNPLWIIRNNEVLETKADKQPIGQYDHRQPYTNHKTALQKGDIIYIFSDGYVDQFGGPKGKKFKSKPFKALLLTIQNETMDKQKELIEQSFESWRGKNEQVDDVCVIGVRV